MEIKPCPFCQSDEVLFVDAPYNGVQLHCCNCASRGPASRLPLDMDIDSMTDSEIKDFIEGGAIDGWNNAK